jgi:hypothetical protein
MASEDAKCSWTGTLPELDEHTQVCGFQSIICPFDCDQSNLTKAMMTMKGHFAACPGFFLNCRHCFEFFTRSELALHESCCPEELIPCIWDCGNKQTRRESERHNEEYLMLHMKTMKKAFDIEIQKRELLEEKSVKLHKELLDNETKERELLEKKVTEFGREGKKLNEEVTELKKFNKKVLDGEIQKRELLQREVMELKESLAKSAGDLEKVMRWCRNPFNVKTTYHIGYNSYVVSNVTPKPL